MTNPIREAIADVYPHVLFLSETEYDHAIVGVVENSSGLSVVAYDTKQIVNILTERLGSEDDAREWFDYNIIGAYMGEGTPVFITTVDYFWVKETE